MKGAATATAKEVFHEVHRHRDDSNWEFHSFTVSYTHQELLTRPPHNMPANRSGPFALVKGVAVQEEEKGREGGGGIKFKFTKKKN